MKILYFAWLRTKLGISEEEPDLPASVTTLFELIEFLKARGENYTEIFADLSVVRIAVDQEYVTEDVPLSGVREIAFFPPVTGG